MLRTVVKYILMLLLGCFIALNLILGYFGTSTVFLTLTVYGLAALVLWYLPRIIVKGKHLANARLMLMSLMLTLLTGEMALRYIVRSDLSYSESNGHFFYNSMYRRDGLQSLALTIFPDRAKEMTVVNRPNTVKQLNSGDFTYAHRYNSLGLRDDEPVSDTSHIAMIALGDSFTEGQGAPQDSSWPVLLEQMINDRSCLAKPVNILNAGLAGSDVFFEYRLLEEHLPELQPQVVILAVNTSDIVDVIVRGGNSRFGKAGRLNYNSPPAIEYIYQFSFIFRSALHFFGHYDWMLLTPEQHRVRTEAAMRTIKACILQQYVPLARSKGFKLIIVLNPRADELESRQFAFNTFSQDTAMTDAVPIVNLYPKFKEWHDTTGASYASIFWPTDKHHNSKGYRLFAQMLADECCSSDSAFAPRP